MSEPQQEQEQTASRDDSVLGVDYGTVRIGLALGFRGSGLVLQLPILPNPGDEDSAARSLAGLVAERAPVRVVMGNPVHTSGDPSAMSKTVARVAEKLRALVDVPVVLQDERRTSKDAEERLTELGLRWWQYDKGQVDTLAAMAIVRADMVQENPRLALLQEGEEPPQPPSRESRKDKRRRARRRR